MSEVPKRALGGLQEETGFSRWKGLSLTSALWDTGLVLTVSWLLIYMIKDVLRKDGLKAQAHHWQKKHTASSQWRLCASQHRFSCETSWVSIKKDYLDRMLQKLWACTHFKIINGSKCKQYASVWKWMVLLFHLFFFHWTHFYVYWFIHPTDTEQTLQMLGWEEQRGLFVHSRTAVHWPTLHMKALENRHTHCYSIPFSHCLSLSRRDRCRHQFTTGLE